VLATASAATGVLLLRADRSSGGDIGAVPPPATATTAPAATPTSPSVAAAPSRSGSSPRTPAKRATARPAPAAPAGLAIPSARLTVPVVPVGVRAGGDLDLPASARTVGWWVGSAPAGDRRDTTLIGGHVDAGDGVGALAALLKVAVGDRVELTDIFAATHRYRVVARRTYPKYALPADLFQVAGRRQLVLITCGGPFDEQARRYRDNVVVYAVPT